MLARASEGPSTSTLVSKRPLVLFGALVSAENLPISLAVHADRHQKGHVANLAGPGAPDKRKNNFLITHKPNIVDALGKDFFDVKEGEASIFKPEGGKYQLVARVQMEGWPKLAVSAN